MAKFCHTASVRQDRFDFKREEGKKLNKIDWELISTLALRKEVLIMEHSKADFVFLHFLPDKNGVFFARTKNALVGEAGRRRTTTTGRNTIKLFYLFFWLGSHSQPLSFNTPTFNSHKSNGQSYKHSKIIIYLQLLLIHADWKIAKDNKTFITYNHWAATYIFLCCLGHRKMSFY